MVVQSIRGFRVEGSVGSHLPPNLGCIWNHVATASTPPPAPCAICHNVFWGPSPNRAGCGSAYICSGENFLLCDLASASRFFSTTRTRRVWEPLHSLCLQGKVTLKSNPGRFDNFHSHAINEKNRAHCSFSHMFRLIRFAFVEGAGVGNTVSQRSVCPVNAPL